MKTLRALTALPCSSLTRWWRYKNLHSQMFKVLLFPLFFSPSPLGMLRRAQRIGSVKMEERGRHTKVEFPVKLLSHVNQPASLSWHSETNPTPALCLLVCVCVCVCSVFLLTNYTHPFLTSVCFLEKLQRWQDSWTNEGRDKHLDRTHQVDGK